jgi:DnaJ family protein C protein 11
VKGLEQNDMQLVVRSKTPQEIREEYERLSREREERRLEKLTNSEVCFFFIFVLFLLVEFQQKANRIELKGHFSMTINAVNLFDSKNSWENETSDRSLRIGNLNMEQSIDFPISNKDTVTLSGSLSTSDEYGQGSVSASLRRFFSSGTYLDVTLLLSFLLFCLVI